ncbi:MAG: YdiU family protein [Verrucomicrobiota bacterium]
MPIPFDNTYARLPEHFYERIEPTHVPAPELILANRELAAELGIDPDWLESPEGVAVLAGNAVPEGAEPIAQAYAGHQFGGFVPQLGDGRAILLGEVVGKDGQRRDIQLKGSGRTAFSRGGDGKSALGPVLREYLVSEAMAALGVPTTRALGAVLTGERVRRETALPGGVFARVAASHLRIGTFQFFAAQEDTDSLRRLVDYAVKRHFPRALEAANVPLALLENVLAVQARLIAKWMGLGFIHGVMNTDNTTISGETIDYGPCAFMDEFHPQCVFSSIDRGGRYAWANQPNIGLWNLTRFAETLVPLLAKSTDEAVSLAEATLENFSAQFKRAYVEVFRPKFGLGSKIDDEDAFTFAKESLTVLAEQNVDFTLFFRHLTRVASGENPEGFFKLFNVQDAAKEWLERWRELGSPMVEKMSSANPVLIPRNHRVEEAIQAAYVGNFKVFHRLMEAWSEPYTEREEFADLERAPREEEKVRETFCGT